MGPVPVAQPVGYLSWMVTHEQASAAVIVWLASQDLPGARWALVEDMTKEKPYRWIFRYTSAEFLASRDPDLMPHGCGPVVVMRETGELVQLGTGSWFVVEEFERSRDLLSEAAFRAIVGPAELSAADIERLVND